MGGGQYNGKNHGGGHTGDSKKQKCGPYSANGYRPEPEISHLDFEVGSQVTYTGTNKNKNKIYIPNGTLGEIMEKDNSSKLSYFDNLKSIKFWVPSKLISIGIVFSAAPLLSFNLFYVIALVALTIRMLWFLRTYFSKSF